MRANLRMVRRDREGLTVRSAALAITVGLVFTGCSGGGEQAGSPPARTPAAPTASPSVPTDAPTSTATSPDPSTSATPTTTLRSKTAKLRTTAGTVDATVEIYGLVRRDDLVVLQFGVRNDGESEFYLGNELSRKHEKNDVSGVSLVDAERNLVYRPASGGGECVCSTDLSAISPGQTQQLSATYGALEPGTDELDVRVPAFGELADIPIQD